VLISLAVHDRVTWLDHTLPSVAGRLVSPQNLFVQVLSSEFDWPNGAYLTALLPVGVTMVVLVGEVRRHGVLAVFSGWRWVLPTLAAIPALYILRMAFGRPGPGEAPEQVELVGAYPSGAALAVALGWAVCLVVVGTLQPRWRAWLAVLTVLALIVHVVVRVVTSQHWATDILGSYLLVASAFLLAGAARPDRPKTPR
jgi:membrane-associated phospholipid phosphatase